MPKFRKKPVVVEARQFTSNMTYKDVNDIVHWCGGFFHTDNEGVTIGIKTLEDKSYSYHYASLGDWIIKGVAGEFYPCKPDIFEATYELVNEEAAPAPPPHKGPWHVEQNTESTYYHVVNTPPGVYGASAFASYNEAEAIAVRDALNRLAAGASAPTPEPKEVMCRFHRYAIETVCLDCKELRAKKLNAQTT